MMQSNDSFIQEVCCRKILERKEELLTNHFSLVGRSVVMECMRTIDIVTSAIAQADSDAETLKVS